MKVTCADCIYRWYGSIPPATEVSQWHCRKNFELLRHQLPVIGDNAALKASKGCREHTK